MVGAGVTVTATTVERKRRVLGGINTTRRKRSEPAKIRREKGKCTKNQEEAATESKNLKGGKRDTDFNRHDTRGL